MFHWLLTSCLLIAAWTDGSLAVAAHYRLFVLTGQSNSLGTTNGGEADPSPGPDPADACVQLCWHNVADPDRSIGHSEGDFQLLQPQQGGYYPGSKTHWGPEIGFGRTVVRAGNRDIGIIKASRGGGGNTNWSKADDGHMYRHLVDLVHRAVAGLESEGHTCEIVGLMYLQGESDSPAEASQADDRLAALIANLRHDLPHASSLHVVIGGIAAAGTARDTVRERQAALAANDSTIDLFETVDLRGQLADGLHFNRDAKLEIGRRFAAAFFAAGVLTPTYGNLTWIGDSITQGGMGFPSYRYELTRHLLQNRASWESVGSLTGAYQLNAGQTPDLDGVPFANIHDGHWGWRAYWINGRIPLPANRLSHNRGTGTLANWTGQTENWQSGSPAKQVRYTGRASRPDTAIVMIGSNDLSEGSRTAWRNQQLLRDIEEIIRQLRAATPSISIFLCELPPVGSRHPAAGWLNESISAFNTTLREVVPTWSTAASPIFATPATAGFEANSMTHDAIHPNREGERLIATNIARSMGLQVAASDRTEVAPGVADTGRISGSMIDEALRQGGPWSEMGPAAANRSSDGTRLRYDHRGQSAPAMLDGSNHPVWQAAVTGDWTLEIRYRLRVAANGIALWAGTGAGRIIVLLQEDETTSFADRFHAAHPVDNETFHTVRIAHDAARRKYFVWRDDVALTPTGVTVDQAAGDRRLLIGDYTKASFGDGFDLEIEWVRIIPGQVVQPSEEPTAGGG